MIEVASAANLTITEPNHSGLDRVVATDTSLSSVDGEKGELIIAGYSVEELASQATFEEVVFLLWQGDLPSAADLDAFKACLASQRSLPPATLAALEAAADAKVAPMVALRMGAATLDVDAGAFSNEGLGNAILARIPTMTAAYSRLRNNQKPLAPARELGHVANYLYMLNGVRPSSEQVRGLETYMNTVVDHGLNASTFAARVIIATQSDLVSAVTGAIGALKGPLHGGAPGPALDMVFEIGEASRAEPYLRAKLTRGERLMGFGHRVYKVRDPRAEVLSKAAAKMYAQAGDLSLYALAKDVEAKAVSLLDEYKPGRNLRTNVEFYTALLLHGLRLDADLFTPTFAVARSAGWIAHCYEQQKTGRLIRPTSRYVGVRDRKWISLFQR